MDKPLIRFENVTLKFKNGTIALDEINLEIGSKEFIFLTGPTGAGKSTIIKLLLGGLKPFTGKIIINDLDLSRIKKNKIPQLRQNIGVVFQELKLLPDRNVFENIALALEVLGKKKKEIDSLVKDTIKIVGLKGLEEKFPIQLSGGELQRTAIARAIIKKPQVLLADEPTADLDPERSWEIISLLNEINNTGTTIIMATHNIDIVNSLKKRVISLDQGKIIKDQEKGKYLI